MAVHIVDLSHRLEPGRQRFHLELENHPVEEYIPQYKAYPGEWYVMGDLRLCTHVGTHVESPFHALANGPPVSSLPPKLLIGPAAVVDFREKQPDEAITAKDLKARGAHARGGDILLVMTGRSRFYGTTEYRRPYMATDAVKWVVEKRIKALGVDCSGIEDRSLESHEANHRLLFAAGIPIIEDLNNIDEIQGRRCFFIALTLPIAGLDASPIRPLAVEPEDVSDELARLFSSNTTVWE